MPVPDLGPAAEQMSALIAAVPAERPLLDQVIGLAGRGPDWAPALFRS